jgi:hypothetical protein
MHLLLFFVVSLFYYVIIDYSIRISDAVVYG